MIWSIASICHICYICQHCLDSPCGKHVDKMSHNKVVYFDINLFFLYLWSLKVSVAYGVNRGIYCRSSKKCFGQFKIVGKLSGRISKYRRVLMINYFTFINKKSIHADIFSDLSFIFCPFK